MRPFSVYVHVPYCTRKCPYCDFNVHVVRTIPEERYRDALLREIEGAARDETWADRRVSTIFFGGGTPSLFRPETFSALIGSLSERFGIAGGAEIAWEANPEDITKASGKTLHALRAAGITRVSLGVQSFDAQTLRTLGRMHGPADVEHAVDALRAAGFDNVSIDLMFAVPGQSLDDWRADLRRTIAANPVHVSTYGLTYEEGTALSRALNEARIAPIGEDDERAMYETAIAMLDGAGYRHYEISNFARPGFESRHNLTYWSWDDYLGIGAGAHGFARSDPATTGRWGARYANVRAPEQYMERSPDVHENEEPLDRAMALSEFLLLGLRRIDGFRESDLTEIFECALEVAAPAAGGLLAAGMLVRAGGRVALSREGLLLADTVTAQLAATR